MRALGKGSIASWIRLALDVAWWLLWAAGVVLAFAALAYLVMLALIGLGAAPSNTWMTDQRASWPVLLPSALIYAVGIGGSLTIVWRLRRLFANFSSGQPFHKSNADDLRAIWIALLVIELSRYALMAITGVLIAAFGVGARITFTGEHTIDLTTWFAIAVLIVLAEVFREGARMREEQELTI